MTSVSIQRQSDHLQQPFCLLCNSGLKENGLLEENHDDLIHVNRLGSDTYGILNIAHEMKQVHGEQIPKQEVTMEEIGNDSIPNKRSSLSDTEWIRKYQGFLSKTLHLHIEDFIDEDDAAYKRLMSEDGVLTEEEALLFCSKCKLKVEKLYEANEQVKVATKDFEGIRDNLASSMVRTFVDQKLQYEEVSEDISMEDLKASTTDTLLEKWRYIFTGEADRDLKERSLINEIRDEALARNEAQTKTEFPDGTGLSAMELAKMQRMMTACYFTPKMSIVRKKGKLFFRVGIPREDKGKIYNCPICEDPFNHQTSLNIHMRTHKPTQPISRPFHTCSTCGETYRDRKELIFHKRSHYVGTVDGPSAKVPRTQDYYTCCICAFKFASKTGRNSHIKKYHPHDKFFTCTLCLEIFTSESSLTDHFESLHRQNDIKNPNSSNSHPSELFTCVECSKQFLRIKSLIEHRRVHAIDTLTECYYCGMGFEGMQSLQEHTNVTHMVPNPFNCDGCEESFGNEEALTEHMKLKAQRHNTYICETCGRVTRSKESLEKHLVTHRDSTSLTEDSETEDDTEDSEWKEEGEGQIDVCDLCDEMFADGLSLERHVTQHHLLSTKLPFKCDICGDEEGFKDGKDLRKHKIEAHPESIGNSLHTCTVCWNSFPTEQNLETHRAQTHERFKCHICSKVFKLSEHLKRHVLVHTGEKPYHCTICDKSFNQESNLKEHVYRHQGIRPHRCPQCADVAFLRRVHLKDHMLQEHGLGLEDVPSLPIGRAAQIARRAGTHPALDHSGICTSLGGSESVGITPPTTTMELMKGEDGQTIQVISLGTPITLSQSQKPLIVNDVTVRDDGLHERFAPLIMKSLQNKSNQPIIVRRGIQGPDKNTFPYAGAIQIKSGGITTDGEIIEATDGNGEDEGSQQYVIYKV